MVGRIAGVSSSETRERLLRAGAAAFETDGYEGTRVADIAAAAGFSNGALYSHFGSKTELLAEALRAHGSQQLAALFLDDPDRSVIDLLVAIGRNLVDPARRPAGLVAEALVAARRDPDVASMMGEHLAERETWLMGLIGSAQADGILDDGVSAEVLTRFCLMVLLGSLLLPAADLAPVDLDDWSAFISRLASALRPTGSAPFPSPSPSHAPYPEEAP